MPVCGVRLLVKQQGGGFLRNHHLLPQREPQRTTENPREPQRTTEKQVLCDVVVFCVRVVVVYVEIRALCGSSW